ncbi:MAG: alpha/beta hydrolase [Ferruginibacter sp.]
MINYKIKQTFFIAFITLLFSFLSSCLLLKKSETAVSKKFKKQGIDLKFYNFTSPQGNIHYASVGENNLPTLIFIHGSPGGWNEFKNYLRDSLLTAKFRIISIDRPGFGYSENYNALHLQQQADEVGGLINKIKNEKPIYLIGHSYGGPLATLLAADYPEIVSGIVILAGALDPSLEPKEKWRKLFLKEPLNAIFSSDMQQSNAELWYLKKDLIVLTEKLPLIHCPVYVLHAQNDIFVDFKNTNYIKKKFTGTAVQVMAFKKGNHFIPANKHKEIDTLLSLFPTIKSQTK